MKKKDDRKKSVEKGDKGHIQNKKVKKKKSKEEETEEAERQMGTHGSAKNEEKIWIDAKRKKILVWYAKENVWSLVIEIGR